VRLTLAAIAAACCLLAGIAHAAAPGVPARMTYITGLATPTPKVWLALTNGSAKLALGEASSAQISPDGSQVVAVNVTKAQAGKTPSYSLWLYATSGGGESAPTGRTILPASAQLMQVLGWSADSRLILVQLGTSPASLDVVNATTGRSRTIARGIIDEGSFSPTSADEVVYARAQPGHSQVNIYTTSANGTDTRQLTHDGRSEYPLWTGVGIVYSRASSRHGSRYPELQLWLMRPDGAGVRQLTDVQVPANLEGLTPVACSQRHDHLLANFVGPPGANHTEAYVLDLSRRKPPLRNVTGDSNGYIGDAISSDGTSILVTKGTANDLASLSIERIPWSGGKATTIVTQGGYASWDE
jgi:hypothetical protein